MLVGLAVASQSQGGTRHDAALAKHNFIDAPGRHVSIKRQTILAQAHRFQEFFLEDFAGV